MAGHRGGRPSVISRPGGDPAALILCEGKEITISRADAEVVRKIWDGAPSWYGLNRGTSFAALANTVPGPDLSAFRAAGGKMIPWHGTDDSLIPYQATVDYRERVERALGATSTVDRFCRVFLAT